MSDPEKSIFQRLSSETRLAIIAGVVIAFAIGVIVLATSGSSGKPATSEAEMRKIAREGQEAEEEVFGNPTNPSEPRSPEEMIVAHPRDEEAVENQLRQQILTNMESEDPTHKQEAWCNYASAYREYTSYYCEGLSTGGAGGLGRVELTVNDDTGEVSVEEE